MQKVKKFLSVLWRNKGKVILIIIFAAAAGGGWYYYKKTQSKKEKKEELLTEKIKKGDITLEISKDGTFQPKNDMEVNSRADGRIKEIFVKEGDSVKEGQLLLIVQPGQSIHEKYLPIEVTAPMAGMVLRCLNQYRSSRSGTSYELPKPGEFVNGTSGYNPTCIMKIVKPGKYVVPIKVGEYDIAKVYIGMPVKMSNLSQPGKEPYEGFISLISPQPEVKEEDRWNPESSKVEFITVAETKDNIKELIIGLSANVTIELESKKDILRLPNMVIYEEREGAASKINYFVYKQTAPKKAKKIQIKLGVKNENFSELLNARETGLKEGDVLFVDYEANGIELEESGQ